LVYSLFTVGWLVTVYSVGLDLLLVPGWILVTGCLPCGYLFYVGSLLLLGYTLLLLFGYGWLVVTFGYGSCSTHSLVYVTLLVTFVGCYVTRYVVYTLFVGCWLLHGWVGWIWLVAVGYLRCGCWLRCYIGCFTLFGYVGCFVTVVVVPVVVVVGWFGYLHVPHVVVWLVGWLCGLHTLTLVGCVGCCYTVVVTLLLYPVVVGWVTLRLVGFGLRWIVVVVRCCGSFAFARLHTHVHVWLHVLVCPVVPFGCLVVVVVYVYVVPLLLLLFRCVAFVGHTVVVGLHTLPFIAYGYHGLLDCCSVWFTFIPVRCYVALVYWLLFCCYCFDGYVSLLDCLICVVVVWLLPLLLVTFYRCVGLLLLDCCRLLIYVVFYCALVTFGCCCCLHYYALWLLLFVGFPVVVVQLVVVGLPTFGCITVVYYLCCVGWFTLPVPYLRCCCSLFTVGWLVVVVVVPLRCVWFTRWLRVGLVVWLRCTVGFGCALHVYLVLLLLRCCLLYVGLYWIWLRCHVVAVDCWLRWLDCVALALQLLHTVAHITVTLLFVCR